MTSPLHVSATDNTLVTGIGWDVGGWMGANHGAAVCTVHLPSSSVTWQGLPVELSLPEGSLFSAASLVEAVVGETGRRSLWAEAARIVIGIDAPLGFPAALRRLLNGEATGLAGRPAREIDNPLAYRRTDRHIYETHGKKPMSAAFDRLGNNATVAMVHANAWAAEGFERLPRFEQPDPAGSSPGLRQSAPNSRLLAAPESGRSGQLRALIEVYPALLKRRGDPAALPWARELLPPQAVPGTHAYDACLCALMAAAFAAEGRCPALPKLIGPREGVPDLPEEGWIYHAPPS